MIERGMSDLNEQLIVLIKKVKVKYSAIRSQGLLDCKAIAYKAES